MHRKTAAMLRRLAVALAANLHLSVYAFAWVFAITFPIVLGLRVIEMYVPVTAAIGSGLAPLMGYIGLPGELGIAWSTAIFIQPIAGLALLAEQWRELQLTAAQATIFNLLVLEVHTIIVEARIAYNLGVQFWFTCVFRFGTAILMGFALNEIYLAGDWLQRPAELLFIDELPAQQEWAEWLLFQLRSWLGFFGVIFGLNLLMQALRYFHIERLFTILLRPLMAVLGIHRSAATVSIIGLILGLTFGAALLLAEARAGRIPRRDLLLSVTFLGICHSLLDDTLLALLFGADASGVLAARLLFAVCLIAVLSRLYDLLSDGFVKRWLLAPAPAPAAQAKTV